MITLVSGCQLSKTPVETAHLHFQREFTYPCQIICKAKDMYVPAQQIRTGESIQLERKAKEFHSSGDPALNM